jgi:homocysteine S-methyltransferase
MARYRNAPPQLQGDLSLMDGGIVTTVIFHESLHLPHFAAFDLLNAPARSKEGELQ